MKKAVLVKVYIEYGKVTTHEFESDSKAHEFASGIIKSGYIHEAGKVVDYYPPSSILWVRVIKP